MFRDPSAQAAFDRDGYAVLPFLGAAEVERLRAAHRELPAVGDGVAMAIGYAQGTREVRARTTAVLSPTWERALGDLLPDREIVLTSYAIKPPGPGSVMFLHDDRTFVDERRHRALTVWVPLVDTSPEIGNGCLCVVPGSHRMTTALSGTRTPEWFTPWEDWLSRFAVPVALRAGEALVYDSRLLHGSAENRTDAPREALLGAAVPIGAEVVHVVGTGPVRRRVLAVDRGFFVDHAPADLLVELPTGHRVLTEVDDVVADVTPADLQRLCRTDEVPEPNWPHDLDPVEPLATDAVDGFVDRPDRDLTTLAAAARSLATMPATEAEIVALTGRPVSVPVERLGGRRTQRRGRVVAALLADHDLRPTAGLGAAVGALPGLRSAHLVLLAPGSTLAVAPLAEGADARELVLLPVVRATGAAGVVSGAARRVCNLGEPLVLSGRAAPVIWSGGPWPTVLLVVDRWSPRRRRLAPLLDRLPPSRRERRRWRAVEQALAG